MQHQPLSSQETYSNHSRKQEDSNDQEISSSEAGHSSDSEGVVAVVPRTKMVKYHFFIHIWSLLHSSPCIVMCGSFS